MSKVRDTTLPTKERPERITVRTRGKSRRLAMAARTVDRAIGGPKK